MRHYSDRTYFLINVKLPLPEDGSTHPMFFNHIASHLPAFVHRIGDLQPTAYFRSFDVTTSSALIIVDVRFFKPCLFDLPESEIVVVLGSW